MNTKRIHRATSADGTQIAGHVVGQGPPLVLIHGALYDGDTAWTEMLPHLTDRFTCFLPSTRGRGLSADHPDCSTRRMLEDVVAFVDSIGERVPLVGWSGGAMWALGGAARSDQVAAVVCYEPPVFEVIDEALSARFSQTVARMSQLADHGQLLEAARVFTELVATEEEQQAVLESGRLAGTAPNVSADLKIFSQLGQTSAPSPTDPAVLASITVPVLLLRGDRSAATWFSRGIRHIAEHLPSCEIRVVPGAGHSAPGLMPQAVADEVVRFLEPAVPRP
jgi:pimeloyl-ACP methyl ester carboxylesterase